MQIITVSRVFLALGLSSTAVLALADASIIPQWGRLVIAAFGIFTGILTAMSGPVQNSQAMNTLAYGVVAEAVKREKSGDHQG